MYVSLGFNELTHWGRETHKCFSKLTINGSDNGMSPGRHQAIIWTNAGILLIGTLGTNFSEIFIKIRTFSFTKMHLKMLSVKWRPFCLSLNVLIHMFWHCPAVMGVNSWLNVDPDLCGHMALVGHIELTITRRSISGCAREWLSPHYHIIPIRSPGAQGHESLEGVLVWEFCLVGAVFKTDGHPCQPSNGLDQLNLTLGKWKLQYM